MPLRTVAIIGRPNVGKSTLFNRLLGHRRAVVHEQPGVTRDRIIETCDWAGHAFYLVDTGGIIPFGESVSEFDEAVTHIARDAMAAADVIIFMVDGQVGPTAWDTQISRELLQNGKPVVLVVNKTEKEASKLAAHEFYRLGLGDPVTISALHGESVGDMMDEVVNDFPPMEIDDPADCNVAILGRPNVGKSSLLNQLVGHAASLVSDIPGTTRDSIHTDLKWYGRTIRLVDTAGLRRKGKVKESIEYFSNLRSLSALELCDVAVLIIDATQGVVTQDSKIAGLIHDSGKGVVVAFNKWDLIAKDTNTHLKVWDDFCREVPFLTYAPWFTLSAVTTQRMGRILEQVWEVHEARQKRVSTHELNDFIAKITGQQPPRPEGGGVGKIYFAVQAESSPPAFVLSVNEPKFFARHYLRYINNRLREEYGFTGCRIFVKLKRH